MRAAREDTYYCRFVVRLSIIFLLCILCNTLSKSSHAWRQYYAIAAAVGLGLVYTYIVYGNNIIIFTGAGTTVLIIILFKT